MLGRRKLYKLAAKRPRSLIMRVGLSNYGARFSALNEHRLTPFAKNIKSDTFLLDQAEFFTGNLRLLAYFRFAQKPGIKLSLKKFDYVRL